MLIYTPIESEAISCEEWSDRLALVQEGLLELEELDLECLRSVLVSTARKMRERSRIKAWAEAREQISKMIESVPNQGKDEFYAVRIRRTMDIDSPEAIAFLSCDKCEEGIELFANTPDPEIGVFLQDHRMCEESGCSEEDPFLY